MRAYIFIILKLTIHYIVNTFFSHSEKIIYDVVHYKHFFRDQNNSVIPKIRKKIFFIIISKI
jgi:hypothetical protein